MGIGFGIIFNVGGIIGGIDIVVCIFNKYIYILMGKLFFILDFCIFMFIFLIFKDLRLVFYMFLFDFIVLCVIDLIGEGGYVGKGFMIIIKCFD